MVHGKAGRGGANRMAVRAAALRRPPLHRLPDRPRRLRPRRSAGLPRCPDHSFAGFGVGNDVERLHVDCGIAVAGAVDLRHVAAEVLARPELRGAGLKTLAREVMGAHVDKEERVTRSRWDRPLSTEQVRYASIDAFVSYEVGRLLLLRAGGAAAAGDGASATLSQFVSFELP